MRLTHAAFLNFAKNVVDWFLGGVVWIVVYGSNWAYKRGRRMTKKAELEWLQRLRNRHVARMCDYMGGSPMVAATIKHQFDLFMSDVADRYIHEETQRGTENADKTHP